MAALAVIIAITAAIGTAACPSQEAHAASSVRMEAGLTQPATNASYLGTVAWAGKLWYVAGTSTEGVKANNTNGTVTLLSKDSFTNMAYREGDASSFDGGTLDAASNWYYAGTWTNGPADYLGSSVQTYLSTWLVDNLVGQHGSVLHPGLFKRASNRARD